MILSVLASAKPGAAVPCLWLTVLLATVASSPAQTGESQSEIRTLVDAIAARPSESQLYRKLADFHTEHGDLVRAAAALEQGAARCAGDTKELYRAAAVIRERIGQPGQALLDFRSMLRSAPRDEAAVLAQELAQHLACLELFVGRPSGESNVRNGPQSGSGLPVPGGFQVFGRALGVDPNVLLASDAAERVFSYILENTPSSSKVQDNPAIRDTASYVKTYDRLMRHLRKVAVLSMRNPAGAREYVFPIPKVLSTPEPADFDTVHLLSFFGITLKPVKGPSGQRQYALVQNTSVAFMERQQLLRNLGVNLLDPNLHEIRFSIRNEQLPLLSGATVWDGVLAGAGGKSRPLLERFISNPKAMKLYLALSACSSQTREALLRGMPGSDLLSRAEALFALGQSVEFKDGTLVFPGAQSSWEALLETSSPAGQIRALLSDTKAKSVLQLYSALSAVQAPIRSLLTSSPEALSRLSATACARQEGGRQSHDLARVFRRLRADQQGLFFPLDEAFAASLISQATTDAGRGGFREYRPMRVDSSALALLLNRPVARASGFTIADTLEGLSYLQTERPEALDRQTIAALTPSLSENPLYLDLIWDLNPPADLLAKYIEFCSRLARQDSWCENRARTAESLFYLLSALCREGAVTRQDGVKMLAEALTAMNAADEAGFARVVARFLARSIVPLVARRLSLSADAPDLVLQALSGMQKPVQFPFGGRGFEFNRSENDLSRMKGAIQRQRFTPLAALLDVYKVIDELETQGSAGADELKAIRTKLAAITSDSTESVPKTSSHTIAGANVSALTLMLSQKIDGVANTSPKQLCAEVSAALHPELGVTLLAYCYADAGSPGIDAPAFDSNFVRKHRFFPAGRTSLWEQTRIEQRKDAGLFLAGSLSGLSYALCRLETMQLPRNWGTTRGTALVPTLLSDFRTLRRSLLSDRAQEYVALVTRLGRELSALAGLDKSAGEWMSGVLSSLVTPKRMEQICRAFAGQEPGSAVEILTPSEHFLTGAARLNFGIDSTNARSVGTPELRSPIFEQLKVVMQSVDPADAWLFRKEVNQYGVALRRRIGIGERSFDFVDSYERLDRAGREDLLYERMCDLKIRIAELNYSLGLPAFLTKEEGELALREILPQSPEIRADSWSLALERIGRLRTADVAIWLDELVDRGFLVRNPESWAAGVPHP